MADIENLTWQTNLQESDVSRSIGTPIETYPHNMGHLVLQVPDQGAELEELLLEELILFADV